MLLEAEETVCPRRASARGSEKRRRSIGALLDTLLQLYMSLHSYTELRGGALPPLHPPVDTILIMYRDWYLLVANIRCTVIFFTFRAWFVVLTITSQVC